MNSTYVFMIIHLHRYWETSQRSGDGCFLGMCISNAYIYNWIRASLFQFAFHVVSFVQPKVEMYNLGSNLIVVFNLDLTINFLVGLVRPCNLRRCISDQSLLLPMNLF